MRSWTEVAAVVVIVGFVIYWAERSDNSNPIEIGSNSTASPKTKTLTQQEQQREQALKTTTVNTEKSSTPLRMITFEELSSKNGTAEANYSMWLAILSEVYDVSTAPQYYAPNATYNIFTGRDANVPFVTGIFTEEEAAKSITTLSHMQQWIVEHFANDTYKFNKNADYKFVGYLIGELYDESGNPTETLMKVRHNISLAVEERRIQEEKRQAILAERRRKDEERKAANGGVEPEPPKVVVLAAPNEQEL